jgi:hypothetical protein
MRRAATILCMLLAPSAALAGSTELLPDATLRLQGARYEPTATDLHWDTWIGAGAGLVRVGWATLSLQTDVETTAGNTRSGFDATQANYHLEPAIRGAFSGDRTLTLFYHHVSRHEIDRPHEDVVSWNVLGVRASAPFPKSLGVRGRATLSLGHTVKPRVVGYHWEAIGQLEVDPLSRPWGALYVFTRARLVSAEPTPAFPRGGFVDFLLEGGPRWSRGERTLQLFAAYEHRNDVLVQEPGVMDRALLGFRLGLRSTTPAPGP